MKVRLGRAARADLDAIYLHIAGDDLQAADRMVERLLSAISGLDDFPYVGRSVSRDSRELVTVRPYVILYRVLEDRVRIARILHGAQRR